MNSFQAFSKRSTAKFAAHLALSGSIILIQKLFFNPRPQIQEYSKALSLFNGENDHQYADQNIGSASMGFTKELSFDYQLFLLVALLINIIIPRIFFIKEYLPKHFVTSFSPKEEVTSQEQKGLKEKLRDLLTSIMKITIRYSLIYVLFHLLWFTISSESLKPPQIQAISNKNTNFSPRMLEEEKLLTFSFQNTSSPSQSTPPLSLSIGKIRAVLDITTDGFILSHDRNTAFVLRGSQLRILDMRIFHAPVLISSLYLTSTNLLLSRDGKTLYYIHANLIEIIDVSKLENPVLIKNFIYHKEECRGTEAYRCNFPVALSHNEKFLFMTRKDLEIYDISDPKDPKLVNWSEDTKQLNKRLISSFAVTSDNVLYVADGLFRSYNISDLSDIKFIESYPLKDHQAHQILLSKDKKTLFLLSSSKVENSYSTILHQINVSNPKALRPLKIFLLNEHSVPHPPAILAVSPDENQIFIQLYKENNLMTIAVLNLKEEVLWWSEQNLLPGAFQMAFQSTQRIIAIVANYKLGMLELSTSFPNKKISNLANNLLTGFDIANGMGDMILSHDNKLIFGETYLSSTRNMEMWDVSNVTKPVKFKTFTTNVDDDYYEGMFVENKKLFVIGNEEFYVHNISNYASKSFKLLGSGESWSYGDAEKDYEKFDPQIWKATKDGNYLYILQMGEKSRRMKLQIKNTTDSKEMGATTASIHFEKHSDYSSSQLFFTSSNNILFMMSFEKARHISIYNASNRSTIELITSFPLRGISYDYASLSHDDKILFLGVGTGYGYQLEIYNVTNLTSPEFLSSLPLSSTSDSLCLSSDSKTLYHAQSTMILVIDVSDVKAPTISGLIRLPYTHSFPTMILSPNEEVAFIKARNEKRVIVISIAARYTLFFQREKFLLGERYKEDLMLLNFNQTLKMYDPLKRGNYKYIRSSLLSITSNQNVANLDEREPYSISTSNSLPYWMDFNKDNSVFSIEPQHENAMGNYTLCSGFSTQIPEDIFIRYGLCKNASDSEDLMKTLMTMGYIDNRYFSTSRLTSFSEFAISRQYLNNKTLIYNVLKNYYFEPCTGFELVPSLEVSFSETKKISIQTPSSNLIKLDIKLGKNQTHFSGQFLLHSYKDLQSKILENSSRLILEGNLREIEFALEKLVVNIQETNRTSSCNGKIIVTDYLNPQVTQEVDNLCDYFMRNQAPVENQKLIIQSQIDAKTIATGQSFMILLHEKTFTDRFSGLLTYELIYLNKGKRMAIPSWMSFNNLFLSGVPPENVFEREFNFIIIAKNEFKQIEVPFKINVSISPFFAVKIATKYLPYILTIIGLVIYFNKIYNILAKRRYKYPKEYIVEPGQEINSNVIYPVMFISEEKRESEQIWKILSKFIANELGKQSINLNQLASYFVEQNEEDRYSLNKARLISKINEAVLNEGEEGEQQQLKIYSLEDPFTQQTIHQIIINKITMITLSNLPKENNTRKTFEKIKDNWIDIIDWDESVGLLINETRFNQLLENQGCDFPMTTNNSMIDNEKNPLQIPLMKNLDMSLLKDALLAYAFEHQHIDFPAEKVQVHMKYKVDRNFILSYLKFNLKDIKYSQNYDTGYGLEHIIKNDTLRFSGVIDKKFSQKTLVIQIASAKQKILKEIWIHGSQKKNHEKIIPRNYSYVL